MQKITADSQDSKSPDLVAGNIAKLKELFPELVTEGKEGNSVNVDVLKQLVGDKTVTDAEEKYGLNWHGKRKARQLALTPSIGTLRPCPEDSVDWDTTQNLMIEGDNLEVLKLLQKSYTGKVKLIYIDPPYNTGKDFVYPDDFQDNLKNYLELTGQTNDGGKRISSNTESSGRFHTKWINMIYPRLKIAKNLLSKDGICFISISDPEYPHLRLICSEIFGEENFLATLIWMKGKEGGNDNPGFGLHHDYIIGISRSEAEGANSIALDEKDQSRHITDLPEENQVVTGDTIYREGELFQLINLSKQKDYVVKIPLKDGDVLEWDSYCPQKTIDEYIRIGKIFVGSKKVPYVKSFLADEAQGSKPSTLIESKYGTTKAGGISVRELFGSSKVFSYPKPPALMKRLIKLGCSASEHDEPLIVMDFFAGSGSTGQGMFEQCAEDSIKRRFVLVQYPEKLDPSNKDHKDAIDVCRKAKISGDLASLCRERLRRAGSRLKQQNPTFAGDLGFRVFKLDSTNIREWQPKRESLGEELEDSIDHLKTNRTEQDILFELLLKLGLDLCVPIEKRTIAGKTVHSIGAGTLIICLAASVSRQEVETLALGIAKWHSELSPSGETQCVFRDSAFADDVAKTNLTAILEQHGLKTVRSL